MSTNNNPESFHMDFIAKYLMKKKQCIICTYYILGSVNHLC